MRARRAIQALAILGFAFFLGRTLEGCAESTCHLNSECGAGRCIDGKCVRECFQTIDCPAEKPVCNNGICFPRDADSGSPDAPADGLDAAPDTVTPPPDTGLPPTDTDVPPDTTVPPPDTTGIKGYLDGCSSDGDCASGSCTPTAPRFCTRSCTSDAGCADGQICSASKCRLDDSGKTGCDTTTGVPCLSFCYGSSTASHCTHACSSPNDCPAGYACSPAGSGKRVCVDIERPCATAGACASGLGFCGGSGTVGCTAKCDSAGDCPNRLIGLAKYTCELRSGVQVCIPPTDILGSDPIGATCPSTGTNKCRSGGCDTTPSPPICNQRCTARGGCPPGFGCFPDGSGGTVSLICTAAGSGWLGDSCARARDCITGLCDTSGYCTRLCVDALCPTGMSCKATGLTADDGTPISICRK